MKKYEIEFSHRDIFPEDDDDTVYKIHRIGEISIEVEVDGGRWWIESVKVAGQEANAFDFADPSHFEGPEKIWEMIEAGDDVETAAERGGAKWMVKIGDDRLFYFDSNY